MEAITSGMFRCVYSRKSAEDLAVGEFSELHTVGAARINALASGSDSFYEAYDVEEGDPMYTAPEKRLALW